MEDLQECKEGLQTLITENADAIGELQPRVETNGQSILDLEGDIEENTLAIEALQSTLATNGGLLVDFDDDADELEDQIELAAASALIEDFFETNENRITRAINTPLNLIEPFCAGPGVFIFQLTVNYFSEDPNFSN